MTLDVADLVAMGPPPPEPRIHPPPPTRIAGADAESIDQRIVIAGGLSLGAGLIHVVAADQHLQEHALYALFFSALAVVQLAWAATLLKSSRRSLLRAGAAVSLGVVALWIASRTTGLPTGPQPWTPEPVGAIDAIATADEFVLALLVAFPRRMSTHRRLTKPFRATLCATGLGLIMLSSLIAAAPPGHVG